MLRLLLACAFAVALVDGPAAAQAQDFADDATLTEAAPVSVALERPALAPPPLMPTATATQPASFAATPSAAPAAQATDRRTTLYIVGGVALMGVATAAILLLTGGDDGDDRPIAEPPGRP